MYGKFKSSQLCKYILNTLSNSAEYCTISITYEKSDITDKHDRGEFSV